MSNQEAGYMTELHLGSNGRLYDDRLSEGLLICRPWGTGEEMLLNSAINRRVLMNRLISSCCDLPDDLDPLDLCIQDRFQIFFHQRNISYPRPYSYKYRCEDCGKKNHAQVSLQDLEVKHLADDFREPVQTLLPNVNVTVGWRFLTGKDEKQIDKYKSRMLKTHPNIQGDPSYKYRIAIRISELNGEICKLQDALKLVDKIVGEDSLTLRDAFDEYTFGIVPKVEPECRYCGWENGPFSLPFDDSFFRPKRNGSDPTSIDPSDPVESPNTP